MSRRDDLIPEPRPLPSGHVFGVDASGKFVFQPTAATSHRAEEFEQIVQRLGDLREIPIGAALILLLPMRNAVLTPASLNAAAAVMHTVYRVGDHLALEWSVAHGWRDRRFLDPVSSDLLARLDRPYVITGKDHRLAREHLQRAMQEADSQKVWHRFCACASAWWSDSLSTLLWSHCAGVSILQPWSRSTWARCVTGLPLYLRDPSAHVEITPAQTAFFQTNRQSSDADVVVRSVYIVRDVWLRHKSKQHFKDAVLKDLHELLLEAREAGRVQVLIVGFVIDLVINGGVRGELALSSLLGYLSQTLVRLFKALVAVDLRALDGAECHAIYRSVLEDETLGERQRNKVAATLAAFHDYLAWLGVSPLPTKLGGSGAMRPPRAEAVFQEDIARAVQWLDTAASAGDRLACQAILALLLLDEFMARIEEVLGIRLGDFESTERGLTLYLYPRIRDGRMKADAVRRAVDLKSPDLIKRLHVWIARRKLEGGEPEDFLFGAPRARRERYEHGATYALVEEALKVGSGASDATSHGVRHRRGSEEGQLACLPSSTYVDFNPIDQISAGAGQGLTQSLRETYLNLYELPLYQLALQAWGAGADATTATLPQWVPSVEAGIALDRDGNWALRPYQPAPVRPLRFTDVWSVLIDLSQRFSVAAIATRTGVSTRSVQAIAQVAACALNTIRPEAERGFIGGGDLTSHILTLIDLKPLITASGQPKYHPVRQWMEGALLSAKSRNLLTAAVAQWKSLVRGFCIDLDEIHHALALTTMLRAAAIPRNRILITHRCPASAVRPEVRSLGWHLRFEEDVRRGLPRIRLHVCSVDADSPGAIDAAISIKGLLGLLAAAEAWLAVVSAAEVQQ